MINRGVWRKIDKMKIPENRRLIGNKWVFKIKRDGTYRARLVALGYSQIPGVDFTDNFAPVAHDVSFRIALARMMVEKLDSLVMDVETAFLYGDIEEEIFMKSPVGMEEIDPGSSPEDCYQLKKGIYGLCQAARQFWKKFVETIKKEPFGFTVSRADPCMLFKENNLGICIIIMYVDDMLIIWKKEQIQEFATMIQKEFSVKIQHNLADYLGCEFHMNKEKTKGWLGQPSIIKSLEQKLGEKAMKARLSLTPGTPRVIARRLENEEDKVNAQDHETYRSGVGTLLYLTKHSRPDISNPVRELSKTMDAPAPAHLKERYKLIRFVLATKDHGLKFKLMKSMRKWVLKALSDSDFVSDKETRISIYGYVIYDRIPSTTPGAESPRDASDSGSARSHSMHLETSSSDRPKMVTYTEPQTVPSYMSVKGTRRTIRMPNFTRATHAQPSLSNFPLRDSNFGERTRSRGTTLGEQKFPTSPQNKITKFTHCSIYTSIRTISSPHTK